MSSAKGNSFFRKFAKQNNQCFFGVNDDGSVIFVAPDGTVGIAKCPEKTLNFEDVFPDASNEGKSECKKELERRNRGIKTNAELFKETFGGLMATELWSMPEKEFLEWLNQKI